MKRAGGEKRLSPPFTCLDMTPSSLHLGRPTDRPLAFAIIDCGLSLTARSSSSYYRNPDLCVNNIILQHVNPRISRRIHGKSMGVWGRAISIIITAENSDSSPKHSNTTIMQQQLPFATCDSLKAAVGFISVIHRKEAQPAIALHVRQ